MGRRSMSVSDSSSPPPSLPHMPVAKHPLVIGSIHPSERRTQEGERNRSEKEKERALFKL